MEAIRLVVMSGFTDCFTNEEWNNLQEAKNQERDFFDYWTCKESVLKADGRGPSVPLSRVNVNRDSASVDGKSWNLIKLGFDENYSCHFSTDLFSPKVNMRFLKFDNHS